MSDRNEIVSRVTAGTGRATPAAIRNARQDARQNGAAGVVSDAAGVIVAAGVGDDLRTLLPHGGARPGRS